MVKHVALVLGFVGLVAGNSSLVAGNSSVVAGNSSVVAGNSSAPLLPNCTYDSCPVCLADAKPVGSNISVIGLDGQLYSTKFRLARAMHGWDSQSMVMTTLGILMRDKFGVEVTYLDVWDEVMTVLSILGCTGWFDYECDPAPPTPEAAQQLVAAGRKTFPDSLPDIFASLEVWPGALDPAELEIDNNLWENRDMITMGATGFMIKESLWLIPEAADAAWNEKQISLTDFRPWMTDLVKEYISVPQEYKDAGVRVEVPGCPDTPGLGKHVLDGMATLTEMGYVCRDSWWLTPACAALGNDWWTECVAVLDDDWGYPKPDMWRALTALNMRVAKLTLGYDTMYDVIHARNFNTSFLWWDTDTQFISLNPLPVHLSPSTDTPSLIIQKTAWSTAAKYNKMINTLLSQYSLNNKILNSMLRVVSEAQALGHGPGETDQPGFYQKLACDWMRANEEVWSHWLPNPKACSPGEVYNTSLESCIRCPAGTFFQSRAGGGLCEPCEVGTSQPLSGQLECEPCTPGTHGPERSLLTCQPCAVGRFSETWGASLCESCADNKGNPELWTSLKSVEMEGGRLAWFPAEASENRSACGCKEGAWMRNPSLCEPCLKGMSCPGGFTYDTAPGYFSTADEPLDFYLCLDKNLCPGGSPGTCAGDRVGLLCEACPEGEGPSPKTNSSRGSDGYYACAACSGGSSWLIGIILVLYMIGCFVIYRLKDATVTNSMDAFGGLVSIFTLLTTTLQVIGIIRGTPMTWPATFEPVLSVGSAFLFDIGFLNLRCSVGTTDFWHYTSRVLMFLSASFVVWFCHLLSYAIQQLSPCTREWFPWKWRNTVNLCGLVTLALYTSIVAVAAFPMSCYSHPNGQSSVRGYPAVLCGSSEHKEMLAVGVCTLLAAIAFLAFMMWGVWRAPGWILEEQLENLSMVHFLVNNYQADGWYWGITKALRSLLLSLTPAIFPSDGAAQLFTFSLLFWASGLAQVRLWPWKLHLLNWTDALNTLGMGIVIVLAAALYKMDNSKEEYYGILMTIVSGLMLLVMFVACMLVVKTWLLGGNLGQLCGTGPSRLDPAKLARSWLLTVSAPAFTQDSEQVLVQVFSELAAYDLEVILKTIWVFHGCGLVPPPEDAGATARRKTLRKPGKTLRLPVSSTSSTSLRTNPSTIEDSPRCGIALVCV